MENTIGVVRETAPYETRVALAPEGVAKLQALNFTVLVEKGAGEASSFPDEAYVQAGAQVVEAKELFAKSQFIFSVNILDEKHFPLLNDQHILIGNYAVYTNKDVLEVIANSGAELWSLDLMPRISRAQSMDVLSSQNNLAGYFSVLLGATTYNRALPLMMTSAGMIPPSKVFVMGIGVAGLQAIATAKRLGAVVSAYDVRAATKEQAESLGAKFLVVDEAIFVNSETAGGYAKELPADYKEKEKLALGKHILSQDIIITTALIPGKKAPMLIDEDMLTTLQPGTVIVDLAASGGGNTAATQNGEVVTTREGVTVVGEVNCACKVPATASTLFGNNIINLLKLYVKPDQGFKVDYDDDITKGILVAKDGKLQKTFN